MIPKLNGPGKDGGMEFIRELGNRPNLDDGLDADGLKAKFDAAAEYIRTYINEKLIPSTTAENIPFSSASGNVSGETVAQALEWLKEQMAQSQLGQLGNNTITAEKLTAEVRALVESNALIVSTAAPTGENNTAAGNPINQFWIRTEDGACAELFFHVTDGKWWSVARQVLPAARGGTGMAEHTEGSMLYGDENGGLKSLPKPGEQSFLLFEGTAPGWVGKAAARSALGVLNTATGSYTGDGDNGRELELQMEDGTAIEPKLLTIYNTEGATYISSYDETIDGTVTLCQGAEACVKWYYSTDNYIFCVKLEGSKLKFRKTDGSKDIAWYCNKPDVVYNWFALY